MVSDTHFDLFGVPLDHAHRSTLLQSKRCRLNLHTLGDQAFSIGSGSHRRIARNLFGEYFLAESRFSTSLLFLILPSPTPFPTPIIQLGGCETMQ